MRKLKLDAETLKVETFVAAPGAAVRGTVAAHGPLSNTCPPTQIASCDSSCWRECQITMDSCYITGCYDACEPTVDRDRC